MTASVLTGLDWVMIIALIGFFPDCGHSGKRPGRYRRHGRFFCCRTQHALVVSWHVHCRDHLRFRHSPCYYWLDCSVRHRR